MSIEEWPEGATHYCPEGAAFDDLKYGEHWVKDGFYIKRGWVEWKVDTCRAPSAVLIPLPTKPAEWDGEGLPPVGTVCEWKEKPGFQWVKATVLFITDSSVVMQRSDGFEWQMMTARTVFRPIRTPAQIEAEKREDAISTASEEIKKREPSVNYADALRASAALYDAGLLRVDE